MRTRLPEGDRIGDTSCVEPEVTGGDAQLATPPR